MQISRLRNKAFGGSFRSVKQFFYITDRAVKLETWCYSSFRSVKEYFYITDCVIKFINQTFKNGLTLVMPAILPPLSLLEQRYFCLVYLNEGQFVALLDDVDVNYNL